MTKEEENDLLNQFIKCPVASKEYQETIAHMRRSELGEHTLGLGAAPYIQVDYNYSKAL